MPNWLGAEKYICKQNQAFHKMDKLFTKAVTNSQTLAENVWSFLHLTNCRACLEGLVAVVYFTQPLTALTVQTFGARSSFSFNER